MCWPYISNPIIEPYCIVHQGGVSTITKHGSEMPKLKQTARAPGPATGAVASVGARASGEWFVSSTGRCTHGSLIKMTVCEYAGRIKSQGASQRLGGDDARRAQRQAQLEALEADNFADAEVGDTPRIDDVDYYLDSGAGTRTFKADLQAARGKKDKDGRAPGAGAASRFYREPDGTGSGRRAIDIAAADLGSRMDSLGRLVGAVRNSSGRIVDVREGAGSSSGGAGSGYYPSSAMTDDAPLPPDDAPALHYFAAAMGPPSSSSARHWCVVCGFSARYTCTRCGLRLCSNKCGDDHADTKCPRG